MQDDIRNYLPTVMFRGTPCIFRIHGLNCLKDNLRDIWAGTKILQILGTDQWFLSQLRNKILDIFVVLKWHLMVNFWITLPLHNFFFKLGEIRIHRKFHRLTYLVFYILIYIQLPTKDETVKTTGNINVLP